MNSDGLRELNGLVAREGLLRKAYNNRPVVCNWWCWKAVADLLSEKWGYEVPQLLAPWHDDAPLTTA